MPDERNFENGSSGAGAANAPIATLSVGSGRLQVKLELRFQGSDFLLLVTGGKAHVGAVAVYPADKGGCRAVVTEMPGHREGPLAGDCAEILGQASGRAVAVVAGIHQDDATAEEISAIVTNVRQGTAELAEIVATYQRTNDD